MWQRRGGVRLTHENGKGIDGLSFMQEPVRLQQRGASSACKEHLIQPPARHPSGPRRNDAELNLHASLDGDRPPVRTRAPRRFGPCNKKEKEKRQAEPCPKWRAPPSRRPANSGRPIGGTTHRPGGQRQQRVGAGRWAEYRPLVRIHPTPQREGVWCASRWGSTGGNGQC
ncbi:hypothetical protein BT67DRAFT_39840 [Trichocladium antarcticum]|uniref:Uncharacterized protein n=1 Tax=Trichocladium antarcticum TaxID=1450529 RepID=A0AAN6UIL2_9PEZI|nr:hypothetical protein BT67DRAFT_39840 [Trichocladium antarcticum]